MSRPILNADDHLRALGKESQNCISVAVRYVLACQPRAVHLYERDHDRIVAELKGAGFDLGRGFRIKGVCAKPLDGGGRPPTAE